MKDTFCYQVFSEKYFPDGDFFNHKAVNKPSYVWFSINKVAKELEEGFGWQIGNGRHINKVGF